MLSVLVPRAQRRDRGGLITNVPRPPSAAAAPSCCALSRQVSDATRSAPAGARPHTTRTSQTGQSPRKKGSAACKGPWWDTRRGPHRDTQIVRRDSQTRAHAGWRTSKGDKCRVFAAGRPSSSSRSAGTRVAGGKHFAENRTELNHHAIIPADRRELRRHKVAMLPVGPELFDPRREERWRPLARRDRHPRGRLPDHRGRDTACRAV
jgi:hypothetical protein